MSTAMVTIPAFPSIEHEKGLKQKHGEHGWKALTPEEKGWWHSYVYGWRRVFLSNREKMSPADPEGIWFLSGQADDAEAMYRAQLPKRREKITPAMQAFHDGKQDLAMFFDDQDRERRNFKGTDEEFVALCMRQVSANCARWEANMRRVR